MKVVTRWDKGIMASLFSPGSPGGGYSSFVVLMGIDLHGIICLLFFKLLWKSFLIGPLGGQQPSIAFLCREELLAVWYHKNERLAVGTVYGVAFPLAPSGLSLRAALF